MALRLLSTLSGASRVRIHNAGWISRAGMCSLASMEERLRAVVDGLGSFLHSERKMPAEVAQAIAGNASTFARQVLDSFESAHGQNSSAEIIAEKIQGHLAKMRVDKVLLFYESIGMELPGDGDPEKMAVMRTRYQHVVAVTAFLEELKVERKTVGNLLEKNKFLFEANTSEVFNLFQYLHTNGVVAEGLQVLCSRYPGIFTPSIKDHWEPFLQVLRDFEIQEPAMRRLIKHFGFLLLELPKIDYITTLDYLQLDLNLEKPEISRILKSHPEALLLDFNKTMKSKVKFLRSHKVHPADIARIFARCPSIVGYSVDSLSEKIGYLQGLGLRPWNVRQILVAFPAILAHSVENKMKPTVAFLEGAGITGEKLSKLIVKRPAIFAIDNKEKLPRLLKNIAYLGPDGMVLALCWGVAEGIRHMKSRLKYLQSLGFSGEDLVKMISRDPRILKISKDGLETKVKYLTEVMGLSPQALLGNPTFLYSHFERRIKLRYEVLKLLHDRGELSREPQLSQMLYMDNKEFMARYVNPYRPCVTLAKKHYRMFQRKPDGDHLFMMKYLDEQKESPLPEGTSRP
ncbi:hypothetical protein SELMODRAFT_448617 [Selaginella moellendorffii]|uniref:Uncharacterized protein n=1 Tax=Selaginella moellendorffii TaxID=88036 RepID=D8T8M3_SELML|nr:transcription termination factor MTERF2, chloroplastic [Selaginella moellendorffii]XP_024521438.1 transcription termination factor MTERF2, chloroplastic [Selaginella moellendorffii]XP_024521439.1 transcription termination factor MTERF2, chloroplastic [Selaginella moellendorffii]EFJ07062.1 hypothetical protein SELMODRAFT_448617 [Selaginella moellendorffii]|eukprot:XP_002991951.1 transcription termination factor MTERF2, chloroplastic [Selaginella moellendorffii]